MGSGASTNAPFATPGEALAAGKTQEHIDIYQAGFKAGRQDAERELQKQQITEWSQVAAPPTEMRLEQAIASKACLGPLAMDTLLMKNQLVQRLAMGDLKGLDPVVQTKHLWQINNYQEKIAATDQEMKEAELRFSVLRIESSAAMAQSVGKSTLAYSAAMEDADVDGSKRRALSDMVAGLVNRGELAPGSIVRVIENGELTKGRVEQRVEGDNYSVCLWHEVGNMGMSYELGFDTTMKLQNMRTVPRRQMYANMKQRQHVPGCSASTSSLDFLVALFQAAEVANQRLVSTGQRVASAVNNNNNNNSDSNLNGTTCVIAKNAPLKALKRVQEKTAEKYDGDFSLLTDLARMTYACDTVLTVHAVVEQLVHDPEWELILAKNRLMAEFDAYESGGYRDLLLNMRCKETGHIVEMQVTLQSLLRIKSGGGHAAYKLGRILDLSSKETMEHSGSLNEEILRKIKFGMIRKIRIEGDGNNLAEHFDGLREALSSPSCLVDYIWHITEWPQGRKIEELYSREVFKQLAPRLEMFTCGINMNIAGTLPAEIFDCVNLQDLRLPQTSVSLDFARIGKLRKLETVICWSMPNLTGEIPSTIVQCKRLRWFQCFNANLSGEFPIASFEPLMELIRKAGKNVRCDGNSFSNQKEMKERLQSDVFGC